MLEFTYSLASDQPGRPLGVVVNGGQGGQGGQGGNTEFTLHFPATGSWEEWGTVSVRRSQRLNSKHLSTLDFF